jgi:hypothetical protein
MPVGEEIIIKDPAGKFKILRSGKFYDFIPPVQKSPARIEKKLVDQILEKSGLRITENLKTRFAEEIEAYFKDVRDKFETKSALIRAVASGGMGFTPEQADLVIKLIEENKQKKEEIQPPKMGEETDSGIRRAEFRPAARTAPKPSIKKPEVPEMSKGVAEFVFSPADEAEVSSQEKKIPKTTGGLKPAETEKLIGDIIGESKIFLDAPGKKKLEGILLTHLKDIRDGFETQDTLFGLADSAGIALTRGEVTELLRVVKNKVGKVEEKFKNEAVSRTERAIEEEKQLAGKAGDEVSGKIRSRIDERWQQITKKTDVTPLDIPAGLIAPPAAMQANISTVAPPKPVLIPEKVFPPVRAVAEEKKTMKTMGVIPMGIKNYTPSGEEPKPLQIFKSVTAPARRPAPLPDDRPRLDDIKYVPKLVGPVEELKEMTLVDFKRLDKDPGVAVAKIQEKIRLLEKDSITKKIAGIKAWQESEISKLYLEISRESLGKGVPVGQVIALLISAGKPTLTETEYKAVMQLSRSLRY